MSGRYFVVVDAKGVPHWAGSTNVEATRVALQFDDDGAPDERPHTVVECIAMPRVRVKRGPIEPGLATLARVFINGCQVGPADLHENALQMARDLRRALRKGK